MTPEEQWVQINHAIQALVGVQSKHDERIEKLDDHIEKLTAKVDKNAEGIRDLIVVSRTLIDSHLQIDAKLDRLLDGVDRLRDIVQAFIKSLQKPNGQN